MTSRDRFTDLMVVVDPHIVPADDNDQQKWGDILISAVQRFVTPAVLKAVLLCEDSSRLKRAQLVNASVELGDKYGRIHIHFNLNLTHQTKVLLKHPDGREINDQFQQWFNAELGRSCFVSVRLADSGRAKNYATKSGVGGGAISIDRGKLEGPKS